MNRRLIECLVSAILVLTTAAASANPVEQLLPTSFEEALRFALSTRDEVAIEDLNVVRSRARVAEARGAFSPSLDYSSQIQRVRAYDDFSGLDVNAKLNNTNIPIQVKSTTPAYQSGSALELSYKVYSGGARAARVDEAEAEMSKATGHHGVARQKVAQEVSVAYWGMQKAQLALERADKMLALARAESDESAMRLQKRLVAPVDRELKLLALQKAEVEQRHASRNLHDARSRYVVSLGLVPGRPWQARMPPVSERAGLMSVQSLFEALDLVQDGHGKTILAEMEAAKARVEHAKSDYRPTVDLVARYAGLGRADTGFGGVYDGFGRDKASLAIQLRWNIFDGGQKDQRVVQAVALYNQARIRLEKVRRDGEIEWQEALSRQAEAVEAISLANEQLALADRQLRIAQQRFVAKAISATQLAAARFAVEDANVTVAISEIDHLLAQVAVQLARTNR